MSLNPSKLDSLESPIKRANDINDPSFQNQQGYYPYDLSHQELITPLFAHISPSMVLDTVPADRFVVRDNTKLIRNQINGNLLSQFNQYVDSFYVSLRTLFPNNYEKLIPNPTKGQDLPNSALPQVPINLFVREWLLSGSPVFIYSSDVQLQVESDNRELMITPSVDNYLAASYAYGRLLLLSTIFSRGQLLDYLGLQYDISDRFDSTLISIFQSKIDAYHRELYSSVYSATGGSIGLQSFDLSLVSDNLTVNPRDYYNCESLSDYRAAISDIFESGKLPIFEILGGENTELDNLYSDLYNMFLELFVYDVEVDEYISTVDTSSNPFQLGHISLTRPLAYQLCVAQYFTNDAVDNIFNSDLYMQLLRSVMYPSIGGYSSEPTFNYNGVSTEYDYISAGGFYHSLLSDHVAGHLNRQVVFSTIMLLMRRSLRYGDYFSTARPRMLAVGDLSINAEDGKVSPIDVTRNLLQQRFLNAANYIGSSFMPYMQSLFGVVPSDIGSKPRFISHRKIELQNQITNNTSDNQGKQTTNLVGYSSEQAFDVFIDDFGLLINVISFDVLPVYTSGIDAGWHLSDRFDYFNPMLQNIGDQPIFLSELFGDPSFHDDTFGYTMRNAELKFKNSRAHGAFATNELAGFLMKYPVNVFTFGNYDPATLRINPDFIRDKPSYIDNLLPQQTGVSPCEYWHFIVSCANIVHCARKVQQTPPVLF